MATAHRSALRCMRRTVFQTRRSIPRRCSNRAAAILWALATMLGCSIEDSDRVLEDVAVEPAPPASTFRLRVLSFNTWSVPMREDHDELLARCADAVAAVDADVVALQEVWPDSAPEVFAAAFAARGLRYEVHLGSTRPLQRGSTGLVLASRYPIVSHRFEPFRVGSLPYTPWPPDWYATKGALEVTLETPAGPVRVVDTHVHAAYGEGENEGHRLGQTRELAAWLSGSTVPLILVGDFNTRPGELPFEPLEVFSMIGRSHVDAVFLRDGPTTRLFGTAIEQVLTETVALRSGRRTPLSDHRGVLVEVAFEPAPGRISDRPQSPAMARAVARELRRANAHRTVGRAVTAVLLLVMFFVVYRLRRRSLTLVLWLALLACWAAYHGWIIGPLMVEWVTQL